MFQHSTAITPIVLCPFEFDVIFHLWLNALHPPPPFCFGYPCLPRVTKGYPSLTKHPELLPWTTGNLGCTGKQKAIPELILLNIDTVLHPRVQNRFLAYCLTLSPRKVWIRCAMCLWLRQVRKQVKECFHIIG